MTKEKLNFYGLFDAALIPKIWFNLETFGLNFAPLYQGDFAPIAEAIPYVVELDKTCNSNSVEVLLKQEEYHLGLFISSYFSLDELTKRLAFFIMWKTIEARRIYDVFLIFDSLNIF